MNAVAAALFSALNVSTLTDLLADTDPVSIYQSQAPDNAQYPFVVFNKQNDANDNGTAHKVQDLIYQVRFFTKTKMKDAQTGAEVIDGLLDRQTLTITGYAQLRLVRDSGIEYVENQPSTDKVFSAGSLFRLKTEKTS